MTKISASSLKLYRRCPRRWVGMKVLRLVPPEESAATNLGKSTHSELEAWIVDGKVPRSDLASAMLKACKPLPHKPLPKTTAAEDTIEFFLDGVNFHGVVDWRRKGAHDKHAIVGDWKTSSSLDFALSEEGGLLVDTDGEPDVQSAIYAAHEFVAGATEVSGVWVYGVTTKPHETRVVAVDFDVEKTELVMRRATADGRKMVHLATLRPELNDVPYNPGACNDFRRPCPLISICQRTSGGLFSSEVDPLDTSRNPELLSMDFLSSLKASFPTQGIPAPSAPPPPPPEDDDDLPPPPPPEDDDDLPPPVPVEAPHAAELIADAAVDAPAARDLSAAVEAGFINAPEAAGKKPYANPEAAIAGEGAAVSKTKAAKAKAAAATKKTAPIVATVEEPKPMSDAEVLQAIYDLLKSRFG